MVPARQADLVTRWHHSRKLDLSQLRSLGRNDYLVIWRKPDQRRDWMDKATCTTMPPELPIRMVRLQVAIPSDKVLAGFQMGLDGTAGTLHRREACSLPDVLLTFPTPSRPRCR
jgi:hypothetical protein